ncbi:MAG: hypothetical protein ACI4XP_09725 [Acutalibacteraceae bacterium]
MKKKKTKAHKSLNGQLFQVNKSIKDLKMKQKEKISKWIYEEYKKFVIENKRVPNKNDDKKIIEAISHKISEANIWIPVHEIKKYYQSKKSKARNMFGKPKSKTE